MKRKLTLLSLVLFSFSLFAQSDTTQNVRVKKSIFSLYSENCQKFSHWSVYGKAGLSIFDGDAKQPYNHIVPEHIRELALGLAVEYSFNPRYGLAVSYMWLPISADEANVKFRTKVHSPATYLSINLSNLFWNKRKSYRWDIYGNLGMALAFYKTTLEKTSTVNLYAADGTVIKGIYLPPFVPPTPTEFPHVTKDNRAFGFFMGLNIEYNITKHWAIGWYNQYRLWNKDNFEGGRQWQGITNDAILATTLGLRYKFKPINKCHVRNIDMKTYNGETDKEDQLADLEKRVKKLEDRADAIEPVVAQLGQRVDNIDDYLFSEPDDDGDGVPNSRDRHPNTPKGSFVNFWGEPLPDDVLKAASKGGGDWNIPSIFFDFDKHFLRQRSKDIIAEVALRMLQYPDMKVEIRGYCDHPGTNNYNIKLSVKRCLEAKKELVQVHKIDESRIIINGFGKVIEPASRYQLNRRCDFFFDR